MQANQKQTMIVAVLLVLLLGVGAFQFVGKKPAAAPATAIKKEEKEGEKAAAKEPEIRNPMFAAALPSRDPFKPIEIPKPVTPETQPNPGINVPSLPQPHNSNPPVIVTPLPGTIGGSLPGKGPSPQTAVAVKPVFAYQLAGVIFGVKSAAVFKGPEGNQQLVAAGGWLDPTTQVISIDRHSVTVKFGSQTLQLTTGGNPHE